MTIIFKLIIQIWNQVDYKIFLKIVVCILIIGMEYNFEKYSTSYVDTQNTPYDYASVMHYSSDAFSSNGYPTIQPLQTGVRIGQRYNMSSIDIQEVRLFYRCSSAGTTFPPMSTTTTTTTGYQYTSTYSSSLISNSLTFVRDGLSGTFYYESIPITISTSGNYRIQSNATIDTYGYLYLNSFNSRNTTQNLLSYNDDGAGNRQFLIAQTLSSFNQYVLVLTTYSSSIIGNFLIEISGPSNVLLNYTPKMTTTTTRK